MLAGSRISAGSHASNTRRQVRPGARSADHLRGHCHCRRSKPPQRSRRPGVADIVVSAKHQFIDGPWPGANYTTHRLVRGIVPLLEARGTLFSAVGCHSVHSRCSGPPSDGRGTIHLELRIAGYLLGAFHNEYRSLPPRQRTCTQFYHSHGLAELNEPHASGGVTHRLSRRICIGAWGRRFGGINAFNRDFTVGLRAALGDAGEDARSCASSR